MLEELQEKKERNHSLLMGYLLWIFGFIGAHRFYYGKKITGTLYFLTFGMMGVGQFIDLFLMPSLDEDADQEYGTYGPIDYNITWVLLTFLGIFGAHHFYMRNIGKGIIWLITGGLFTLGLLYDFWNLNEQIKISNETNR